MNCLEVNVKNNFKNSGDISLTGTIVFKKKEEGETKKRNKERKEEKKKKDRRHDK